MNFSRTMSSSEIDAVTVTASWHQSVTESPQMSMIDIPVEKFIKPPVIFGEADVLKVTQLLRRVQSGTEGSTGIYVRGGGCILRLPGVLQYQIDSGSYDADTASDLPFAGLLTCHSQRAIVSDHNEIASSCRTTPDCFPRLAAPGFSSCRITPDCSPVSPHLTLSRGSPKPTPQKKILKHFAVTNINIYFVVQSTTK